MTTRREFLQRSAAAALSYQIAQAEQSAGVTSTPRLQTYIVPQTDLTVSRLAYGTGMLDTSWLDPTFTSKAMQAIEAAYENGITFFDLADTYGHGQSERALGKVLKARSGVRHQIVIQSKCNMILSPKWSPENPDQEMRVDTSRQHILRAVEDSLERLGVEHLDILLLHLPDPAMRPEEVAQAFDDLHRNGKVRYFGVSNHGQAQMELLKQHLHQPLVVNQIRMGLGYYAPVAKLVDYCLRNRIQVQAYSPLKIGDSILKGNLLRPPTDAPAAFKLVSDAIAELSSLKKTNASAIAIAWLLHHPAKIVPVIGTRKPKYISENCAADRVHLSDQEWRRLTQLALAIQPQTPV